MIGISVREFAYLNRSPMSLVFRTYVNWHIYDCFLDSASIATITTIKHRHKGGSFISIIMETQISAVAYSGRKNPSHSSKSLIQSPHYRFWRSIIRIFLFSNELMPLGPDPSVSSRPLFLLCSSLLGFLRPSPKLFITRSASAPISLHSSPP